MQSTDRGGSTITSNWIVGNGQGVAVGGDWSSQVTNNVLNNTDNGFFGAAEVGQPNVTRTAGPNIVGGPEIGGNFWAHPNGTGFSETHPDNDGDGFCDEPYVVNPEEGVTDYLPLALPNVPPVGGDTGYFLVSTTPAGADVYLVDISGTRYLQGNTSAGLLNVTIHLTATPMRSIVANLSGYRDAVYTITQYPAQGQTVPVTLTLQPVVPEPFKPLSVPGRDPGRGLQPRRRGRRVPRHNAGQQRRRVPARRRRHRDRQWRHRRRLDTERRVPDLHRDRHPDGDLHGDGAHGEPEQRTHGDALGRRRAEVHDHGPEDGLV